MIGLPTDLLNPQVGLVPCLNEARHDSLFIDGSRMFSAQSGYLRALHPELAFVGEEPLTARGSGCDGVGVVARGKALVETLERYATAYYATDDVVTASARSLGEAAAAWLEPAADGDVAGPAGGSDPDAMIRWVRGYHLARSRTVFVPLVLVHVHVPPAAGEPARTQSTGGVAAHDSLEQALLAAFYEAVERDAVEAVWAMRLPLAELEMDGPLPAELERFLALDGADHVDQRYYDATSDLGVPTVYAVRTLRPPVGHDVIVTCASHPDPAMAALKARREAAGLQTMRMHESAGACYTRLDGETGFPVADRLPSPPDLSFLGKAPRRRLSSLARLVVSEDPAAPLRRVAEKHPDLIAVNLTTEVLREVGVHVARLIVPTFFQVTVPGSPGWHPRSRVGQLARHFAVAVPARLNPVPQPFR